MVHVEAGVLARQQVVERHDAEQRQDCRGKHNVKHELEEVLHVLLADTVVDPRTVVVHLKDTKTALSAVVGPRWLPRFFANALGAVFNFIVLALERWSHALRDASWVCEGGPKMADIRHKAEAIESDGPEEASKRQRDSLDELLVDSLLQMPVEDIGSIADVLAINDQEESLQRQYC